MDNAIVLLNTYPLDSDLSDGKRYPSFDQSAPGGCNIIIATEVYEKSDRVKSWASEVQFMYNVHILNLS